MRFEYGNIVLSPDIDDNYILIDHEDFFLSNLNDDTRSNKGANSNLFILSDPNGEVEDKVIKICKSPLSEGKNKRHIRFKREIRAFRIAAQENLRNVIRFFKSGEVEILGDKFLYIIMEKADDDLSSYMESKKFSFTLNQKITFCVNILSGIKQLHAAGIYHRDIKHDNILLVDGEFKVGDLGLVRFRNEDFASQIDNPNEKIGPFGWLCPEATNKMLTFNKKLAYTYDCDINDQSDVFQLGKLFWYIFQGNLPVGQILYEDSKTNDQDIFQILFQMLQYYKNRRPTIAQIEHQFEPIKLKYGV